MSNRVRLLLEITDDSDFVSRHEMVVPYSEEDPSGLEDALANVLCEVFAALRHWDALFFHQVLAEFLSNEAIADKGLDAFVAVAQAFRFWYSQHDFNDIVTVLVDRARLTGEPPDEDDLITKMLAAHPTVRFVNEERDA